MYIDLEQRSFQILAYQSQSPFRLPRRYTMNTFHILLMLKITHLTKLCLLLMSIALQPISVTSVPQRQQS